MRVSCGQVVAAAKQLTAKVEVWLQAQQQLGVQTDTPEYVEDLVSDAKYSMYLPVSALGRTLCKTCCEFVCIAARFCQQVCSYTYPRSCILCNAAYAIFECRSTLSTTV